MITMNNGQYIGVQGIWLRTIDDRIQVLVTVGNEDFVVIDTYAPLDQLEMTIRHHVSALGISEALWKNKAVNP